MSGQNSLSNINLSVTPEPINFYFAEFGIDTSGQIDLGNESERSDLPQGQVQPGQSYNFMGPAKSNSPGMALCLVTKDVGGRLLNTICDSNNLQVQVPSCDTKGNPLLGGDRRPRPPQPKPPVPVPVTCPDCASPMNWAWSTWTLFIILIVILFILGGALYSSRKSLSALQSGQAGVIRR
jgi:hypothetical protein